MYSLKNGIPWRVQDFKNISCNCLPIFLQSTVLNLTTFVSIIKKLCQNFLKNKGFVKLHFWAPWAL